MGCFSDRYSSELAKEIPEVDAFFGTNDHAQVLSYLTGKSFTREDPDYFRSLLTPNHYAYLKIAEGCNHPCSFCIIPRMRGSHRSRQQADIVTEARELIAQGVKELNLISQDSTYYGMDLAPSYRRGISSPGKFAVATAELRSDASTLCSLLRELNEIPGDFWIRLLYTHPAHWTDALIQTIAKCSKVARYVDMPLQHIHDTMLERMRRETDGQYIRNLIGRLREGIPGIAIRTTFIVGFPGETDKRFEALLGFIKETKFERLGVFAYSKEDGTRAGGMRGQIPAEVKEVRCADAMAVQKKIVRANGKALIGQRLNVLTEKLATDQDLKGGDVRSWEHGLIRENNRKSTKLKADQYTIARGEADAPDIDGRVYVQGKLPLGDFYWVRVIGHTDYDLIAEPL